jgi:hypothetical protein
VERRFAVHARTLALSVAMIVGAATPAVASPKKHAAKVQFQKGVAAYQKGDYDAASAAFGRSFKLEVDSETLFAWAQSERKLERCDHASELYAKLLVMKLPAENRSVVKTQIAECKDILAAQAKPVEPAPAPAPVPEPAPVPIEPAPTPPPVAPLPQVRDDSPLAEPSPTASPRDDGERPQARSWYRNPVGDTLLVVGLGGLGVGTGLLLSARSAHDREDMAPTYDAAESLDHTAHTRGEDGVIASAAGIAFVAAAIVWYVEKD